MACFVKGAVKSAGNAAVSGKKGKKRAREEGAVAVTAGPSEEVVQDEGTPAAAGAAIEGEVRSAQVAKESKEKTEAQKARKKRKRDNQKARS